MSKLAWIHYRWSNDMFFAYLHNLQYFSSSPVSWLRQVDAFAQAANSSAAFWHVVFQVVNQWSSSLLSWVWDSENYWFLRVFLFLNNLKKLIHFSQFLPSQLQFCQMDTNGDGTLSREEFAAAMGRWGAIQSANVATKQEFGVWQQNSALIRVTDFQC